MSAAQTPEPVHPSACSASAAGAEGEAAPFERAVIAGVGLLGGSLGLALKKLGLARQVTGLGRRRESLEEARALGCVDSIETEPQRALAGADFIALCQPVRVILDFLPECVERAEAGALITDVGSVKGSIVEKAEALLAARGGEGPRFVGSHPMAGSERSGARHARADLYEGATCHVTLTPRTEAAAAARVARLWEALGMRALFTSPERHDQMVAVVSHVPHVIAVALVESLDSINGHPQFLQRLLGPGFRDMTRVAMGSPGIWRDILAENPGAIARALGVMSGLLEQWKARLERGDFEEIQRIFEEARRRRLALGDPPGGPADAESG